MNSTEIHLILFYKIPSSPTSKEGFGDKLQESRWETHRALVPDGACSRLASGRRLVPRKRGIWARTAERKWGGWDGLRSAGRPWRLERVIGEMLTDGRGFHGTERNDGSLGFIEIIYMRFSRINV